LKAWGVGGADEKPLVDVEGKEGGELLRF